MRHLPLLLLLLSLLGLHCRSRQAATEGPRPTPDAPARSLSLSTLAAIYTQALSNSYPYMYTDDGYRVQVSGQSYGTYRAGVKGLLLYSGLPEAVITYLQAQGQDGGSGDFYDLSPYAQLAGGLAPFRDGGTTFEPWGLESAGAQAFHHYNPDLIRWGITNLIPEPGTQIGGQSAQTLYQDIFRPFFRLMAETHLALTAGNKLAGEVAAYRSHFSEPGWDGLAYLDDRYNDRFPLYRNGQQDFTPGMATGFWLRREIDGTRALLWQGLSQIMATYDPAWWAGKTE